MFGYLTRISIEDAKLTYVDRLRDQKWYAPDSSLIFERTQEQFIGNLKTKITLGQDAVDFSIGATHEYGDDRIYLLANLDGLPPHILLQLMPRMKGFVGGERAISGNLELALDEAANVRGADFLIYSEYGEIIGELDMEAAGDGVDLALQVTDFDFSELAEGAEELAPLKALEAKVNAKLVASGKLTGEISNLSIDVQLQNGKINLPDLYDEKLNIKSAEFQIVANDNFAELDIVKGQIDVGEGIISLGVQTRNKGDARDIKLSATLNDFQMKNLHKYWPQSMGTDAWNWVVPNMPNGNVSEATINMFGTLSTDGSNKFELVDMGGKIIGRDMVVNYLEPMPIATGGVAVAEFGAGWLKVHIEEGQVGEVSLNQGYVAITNIGVTDNLAVDLDFEGPVDALLLNLDREPLMFLDDLGFEREGATGQANVKVNLALELRHDLTADQVQVRAEADMYDLYLPNVFSGQSAFSENLNLVVDNEGMDVRGPLRLVDHLLDFTWRENFDENDALESRFNIVGAINKQALATVGLDVEDYADGDFQVELTLDEMRDGTTWIDTAIDLDGARLSLPILDWRKEIGTPGVLTLKAEISKDGKISITPLSLVFDGLIFDGALSLLDNGDLFENLDIKLLEMGENSLKGTVVQNKEGRLIVRVSGPQFDVAGLTRADEDDDKTSGAAEAKDDDFALDILADFDVITDGPDSRLDDVTFDLVYEHSALQVLNLKSFAGTAPFSINYVPVRFGGYKLVIRSTDAGAVMDQLDVSGQVSGGEMFITGRRESADDPMVGSASITDFTVLEAPSIAKILEFMSLTGIRSALGQSGLPFTNLDAEFSYQDGVLDIGRGLMFGDSIGITTEGQIDVDNKEYALKGTVAPAYSLSRAVSWIPLLGNLISGDGGIFAARYTIGGSMDDPDVSVNPISALTPGILRNIFDVFGSDETLSRDQENIDEANPTPIPNRANDN